MTTRLYFLVDDEQAARTIVDDLRREGMEDDALAVVAHRDTYPIEDVPTADITERTDVVPAARRGAAAGGATGMIAGLTAAAALAPGMIVAGPLLTAALAGAGAGAAFGTWASTLVGVGVIHDDLKSFEQAINGGSILVLVDVPEARAQDISATIRRHDERIIIEQGVMNDGAPLETKLA